MRKRDLKSLLGKDSNGAKGVLYAMNSGISDECVQVEGQAEQETGSDIASEVANVHMLFDNQPKIPPLYVTDVELARLLSLSVHTIRKWRLRGKIVPKTFGRSVRYAVDEVVAALEKQKGKYRR